MHIGNCMQNIGISSYAGIHSPTPPVEPDGTNETNSHGRTHMLQTLRETASRILTTTNEAARRTPVEVFLSLLMAGVITADIMGVVSRSENFVFPAFLAWLLTFSISSLHALGVVDTVKRWSLTLAYLAATGVYGVYFFDTNLDASMWRYVLFLAASFFAVTLVPLLAKLGAASPSDRFWRFNTRLLFRGAVAVVFSTGIFVGVASVLAVSDSLFAFELNRDFYQSVASWAFVGLGGVLLAGGLADVTRIDEEYSDGALTWLGRLGTFVFVPTTLAYLAIVYVYLANVLISGESPSNVLSPLMLGAGILGYAGLFVLWPFIERRESALMNAALKWFPAALLPTLPVAIWAIVERIGQYGWTEFRYVRLMAVICLGVFSLVAVVRVLQRQRFSLTSAPVILGAAALFSAVGPWSAPEVSERSQTARFVELATEAGILHNGTLRTVDELAIDDEKRDSLLSSMHYLVESHGPDTIQPFTATDLTDAVNGYDVARRLELREALVSNSTSNRRIYRSNRMYKVRATGTRHELDLRDGVQQLGDWELEIDDDNLVAKREGVVHKVSLSSLVVLAAHEKSYTIHLTGDELSFVFGTQRNPFGQVMISNIGFSKIDGEWRIDEMFGEIILPE